MSYDRLLKTGRIKKQEISQKEIKELLKRSERDLFTAHEIRKTNLDWCFAVAYNAVLQASRAYMFAHGYRAVGPENHKTTFMFMEIALGSDLSDTISYFNRARIKRNECVYETSGKVTETEADNILEKAKHYISLIKERIKNAPSGGV